MVLPQKQLDSSEDDTAVLSQRGSPHEAKDRVRLVMNRISGPSHI